MLNRFRQPRALRKRNVASLIQSRFNVLAVALLIACMPRARAGAHEQRKVQPWDLIRVTVKGLGNGQPTELQRRVSEKGKITLPYTTGEIDAAGKTTDELAKAIDQHYRDAEVVQDAQCKLDLAEAADKATVPAGPAFRGDVLEVRIWDLAGPNAESLMKCEVDGDGKIEMPRVGKIKVVEMTDAQIEKAIVNAYFEAGLLRQAPVAVRRLQAK